MKLKYGMLLFLAAFFIFTQKTLSQEVVDTTESFATDTIPIQYKADILESDIAFGTGVQRLTGNVMLWQRNVTMLCDTAYFNRTNNSFKGVGNIHLSKDSMNIYADTLHYFGNEKIGQFRENVLMTDSVMTLTTNKFDFDLKINKGYYFEGGKIVDSTASLQSLEGYYLPNDSLYLFKDSVELHNEKYSMYTDTLKYNFEIERTFFFGPTNILSEENNLYCENGWYDLNQDVAQFNENARYTNNSQILKGDSLYYNRKIGIGKAFRNVELSDSLENVIINGQYGYYNEKNETSLLTGMPLLTQISDGDSLFLHADTLLSIYDSTGTYQTVLAFHHVKLFRHDYQAKCDSMVYLMQDSILLFHTEPVMWFEDNQVTAKTIEMHIRNRKIHYFKLTNSAFIITMEDSTKFDQVKGRDIHGYFTDGQLSKVEVRSSAESLYYVIDNDMLMGVNKAECVDMDIYFVGKTVDSIVFKNQPKATLYPPLQLSGNDLLLSNFLWLNHLRPKTKNDIFIRQ